MTSGVGFPSGIALDVAGGKMYWADRNANKIRKANLDGSGVVCALTSRPLLLPTLYIAVPECGELACVFVFLTAPPPC